MRKFLVILGSTSTGKTDLALVLAKKFNGELVSCDSRQVYKGLDIGTGKMPGEKVTITKGEGFWEMDGIKVWIYDIADPKIQYTVYDYVKVANEVIEDILKRGKLPIVVGGTGFYLKALLDGLPSLAVPIDQELRKKLEKFSLRHLQQKLQEISPEKWKKMNDSDRQNPRRLIRAIEIILNQNNTLKFKKKAFNCLKIGLTTSRQILYQRIDEWVIGRIKQGMIDEARSLQKGELSYKRMHDLGLEYGVLADYLEGKIKSEEELIKILQGKIHGYARRQATWFKKEKNIFWFDITDKEFPDKLENEVAKWYYQATDDT